MLFSGRHLAQCVIVWSYCLTVMVFQSLFKTWEALRKQRRVREIENDNNAPSEAKQLVLFPFVSDIISCWRQSSPAMGQRSKQAEYLQMIFVGWSHSQPPLRFSDTQWCQRKAKADIISSSALSSFSVDGIQHVFKEPFLWAAQLCGPRVHTTHSLPVEDSCS